MSGPAVFSITIQGRPVPASRPRVTRRGTFNAPAYDAWKRDATLLCRSRWHEQAITLAVAVSVEVTLPRPKSKPRSPSTHALYWHPTEDYPLPTRGDVDNYAKGALDALQQAGVIADDRQVVELTVTKWGGSVPSVEITLHIVEPEQAGAVAGVAAK